MIRDFQDPKRKTSNRPVVQGIEFGDVRASVVENDWHVNWPNLFGDVDFLI